MKDLSPVRLLNILKTKSLAIATKPQVYDKSFLGLMPTYVLFLIPIGIIVMLVAVVVY